MRQPHLYSRTTAAHHESPHHHHHYYSHTNEHTVAQQLRATGVCASSTATPRLHSSRHSSGTTCMPASPSRSPRSSLERDVSAAGTNNNGSHAIDESNLHKRSSSITSASTPLAIAPPTAARGRRESRPITSIATTTTSAPQPPSVKTTHHHGNSASPAATRTEDTTFSLPIDIIDTPDLDELGLSPVGSAPTTRPPSPLSSTPVCLHRGNG